jgi:hypothetical protein
VVQLANVGYLGVSHSYCDFVVQINLDECFALKSIVDSRIACIDGLADLSVCRAGAPNIAQRHIGTNLLSEGLSTGGKQITGLVDGYARVTLIAAA